MTFGQLHFGGLDLGDARRERRLPVLVDRMHKHPGGSLPDKLPEPRDLRAFYRMMNAEQVTHEAVLATHYRATNEAIDEAIDAGTTVLILHDATELDFTSKTTLLDQLGQIGQGTHRGYICHNSLAVRADTKAALGLTSQILHHRADVPKDETAKHCRERVTWYETRFVVEEYHKGMKTGCGIEQMQFTTIKGLEPAIGVLSVLTVMLLNLRDAARAPDADTRPASDVVGQDYIDVLARHYPKRLDGFVSVKAFYMHVARLGGHQNRKCDGFPGWITLWRGWMKLESMVLGYRLGRRKRRTTCGKT